MLEDLFYKSSFTIKYILGNKIKAITLVDTYTIRFSFINKKFAKIVYKKLEIQVQCLSKPKLI